MAQVISHMGEHDRKFEEVSKKAMRLVGGQAERFAKETISDMGAVDTGFLRNSITWALAGEPADKGNYQDDNGTKAGEYQGNAPADSSDGELTVYVGTNVYYAPYVEYGTTRMKARPFLANSIQGHKKEFEDLFKEAFSHFI